MDLRSIDLSTLPDGEQGIRGELEPENIQERFSEADGVQFSKPVQFEAHLKFRGNELLLQASLTGNFEQLCGRCLEKVKRDFQDSLELRFRVSERGYAELASSELLLESLQFNLEEALIDSCVLQVHPFDTPHEGCALSDTALERKSEEDSQGQSLGSMLANVLQKHI